MQFSFAPPLNVLTSRKLKWKEYLLTQYAPKWKIRLGRRHCPSQGEAGTYTVIFVARGEGSDADRFTALPADFKRCRDFV